MKLFKILFLCFLFQPMVQSQILSEQGAGAVLESSVADPLTGRLLTQEFLASGRDTFRIACSSGGCFHSTVEYIEIVRLDDQRIKLQKVFISRNLKPDTTNNIIHLDTELGRFFKKQFVKLEKEGLALKAGNCTTRATYQFDYAGAQRSFTDATCQWRTYPVFKRLLYYNACANEEEIMKYEWGSQDTAFVFPKDFKVPYVVEGFEEADRFSPSKAEIEMASQIIARETVKIKELQFVQKVRKMEKTTEQYLGFLKQQQKFILLNTVYFYGGLNARFGDQLLLTDVQSGGHTTFQLMINLDTASVEAVDLALQNCE